MNQNGGWIDIHKMIRDSSSSDELAAVIAAVVIPGESVDVVDRPFVDLDIDSLLALELFAALEDVAGRQLPDLLFDSINTIADCASWIWQLGVEDRLASDHG